MIVFQAAALCGQGQGPALPQSITERARNQRNPIEVSNPVSEKTRDCTPAEEEWWNGLRQRAGQILGSNSLIGDADRELFRLRNDRMAAGLHDQRPPERPSAREQELTDTITKLEDQRDDQIKEFRTALEFGRTKDYSAPVEDTKITILTNPRPDYTEDARKNKITGLVIVKSDFQADGDIGNPVVIRGLGHGLDEKAIDAVNKIVFVPAIKDGHFVKFLGTIRVSFSLL